MNKLITITILIFLSQTTLGQKYFDTNFPFATDEAVHITIDYDSASNQFISFLVTHDGTSTSQGVFRHRKFFNILYDTSGNILTYKKYDYSLVDTIYMVQKIIRYRDTLRCFGFMYFDSVSQYIFSGNLNNDMSVSLINYYAYPKNDSNYIFIDAIDTNSIDKVLLLFYRANDFDLGGGHSYYTPYVLELKKDNFDSIRLQQIVYPNGAPNLPARVFSAFFVDSMLKTSLQLKYDSTAAGFYAGFWRGIFEIRNFDTTYIYDTTQGFSMKKTLFDKVGKYQNVFYSPTNTLYAVPHTANNYFLTMDLSTASCLFCPLINSILIGKLDAQTDTFIDYKILPFYNPADTNGTVQQNAFYGPIINDKNNGQIYLFSFENWLAMNRSLPYVTCLDTNLNVKWQHFVLRTGVGTVILNGAHTYYNKIAVASLTLPNGSGTQKPVIYLIDSSMAGPIATKDFTKPIEAIRVYPNPSSGQYFFQLDAMFKGVVQIFTIDGKLFKSQNINAASFDVDISTAPTGQYIWKLSDEKSQPVMSNIIIKN